MAPEHVEVLLRRADQHAEAAEAVLRSVVQQSGTALSPEAAASVAIGRIAIAEYWLRRAQTELSL